MASSVVSKSKAMSTDSDAEKSKAVTLKVPCLEPHQEQWFDREILNMKAQGYISFQICLETMNTSNLLHPYFAKFRARFCTSTSSNIFWTAEKAPIGGVRPSLRPFNFNLAEKYLASLGHTVKLRLKSDAPSRSDCWVTQLRLNVRLI